MCGTGAPRDARCMPIVEVNNLHKSYGGRAVVDGVSFEIHEGEIFGVLGPNGAGKTTSVEHISGLRKPDEAPSASPASTRSATTGPSPNCSARSCSRVSCSRN